MESYTQLKKRHEKEFSELKGVFFAFSTEQFFRGIKSIGLDPKDYDKDYLVRFAMGSYCLASTYPQLQELVDKHEKEMNLLKNDPERFVKALVYELQNHEYCYSYETDDSLEVFGLTNETVDPELLARAIEICEKNYDLHN